MSIFRRPPDGYRYYEPREELDDRPLSEGVDKEGHGYDRHIAFQKGYRELMDIVAGLQKDVTRINQCLTLDGAKKYIANKDNWEAIEADVTGPNGKPDGIDEVLVFDSKGNLKVVNGYTLTQSTYPYRKYYRTKYPTPADRKHKPFGEFVDKIKEIGWDPVKRKYNYKYKIREPEFKGLQPIVSAKAIYKAEVFQPQYDYWKMYMKENHYEPMLMARIYNRSLTECYEFHVLDQVLSEEFGEDLDRGKVTEKQLRKFKASDKFKRLCLDRVTDILSTNQDWSTCSLEANYILGWHVQNPTKNGPNDFADQPPAFGTAEQNQADLDDMQQQVNDAAARLEVDPPTVNQAPIVTEQQEHFFPGESSD